MKLSSAKYEVFIKDKLVYATYSPNHKIKYCSKLDKEGVVHEVVETLILTENQLHIVLDKAEVEMETNGELTWTTSKLLIRALTQSIEMLEKD